MPVEPRTEYSTRLERRRAELNLEQRAHRRWGYARLVVFVAGLAVAYAAFSAGVFSAWWLAVPIAVLVALGSRMKRVEAQISRCSRAVTFYERALARLDDRWRGQGDTGGRFREDQHLYANDLDILGDSSLFEFLSVARTERGEATLADWLLAAAPAEVIASRQRAVQELAVRLDLREDLALAGDHARSGVHADRLVAWGECRECRDGVPWLQPAPLRIAAWLMSVVGAIAAAGGVVWIAASLGIVALDRETLVRVRVFTLSVWAVCLAVHWGLQRRTKQAIDPVFMAGHDLSLLTGMLQRLESESFTSSCLAALREALIVEGRPASARIARLQTYVELLNLRRNGFMRLLGPFLLWDLHVSQAVERWRFASGAEIRRWLDAVGDIEALASLACFRYERPTTTFPELLDTSGPALAADDLRHPLLPEQRAVPNSVLLGDEPRVLVVSGSNMSGKSTLLRTIGVNVALAQAGAPVCASRMRLSPLAIGASIRIQDSLQEGTSRFYAEVTRLSRIMQRAGSTPVLFLIDEILHGTNSHDRLIGAEAIVRGFVERGAIGLITTHDLALTRVVDALGARAANVHFQDFLENGTMRFDYRVRPGVVQHSNALELMRSVGLDV